MLKKLGSLFSLVAGKPALGLMMLLAMQNSVLAGNGQSIPVTDRRNPNYPRWKAEQCKKATETARVAEIARKAKVAKDAEDAEAAAAAKLAQDAADSEVERQAPVAENVRAVRAVQAREARRNLIVTRAVDARAYFGRNVIQRNAHAEESDAQKRLIIALCLRLGMALPEGFEAPANRDAIGPERKIEMEVGTDGKVAFKGHFGRYLQENRDDECVSTNDCWGGGWESFVLENLETHADFQRVHIKVDSGGYLASTSEGYLHITTIEQPKEEFVLEKVAGREGVFHIRAGNGEYVTFLEEGQVITYLVGNN